jgi:flagellar hook-associated protein 3 FlgL
MAFRISDGTLFDNAVRHTQRNRFELSRIQNQLGTGKRVNSAGDDPVAASQILGLRRTLGRIEQFDRNIEAARTVLEPTETALASLTDALTRLRELAVSADTEVAEFDKIRVEVEQLFDTVVAQANTSVNGRALFGGFVTDALPFTKTGDFSDGADAPPPSTSYVGDNGVLQMQIGESTTIAANLSGREVFLGSTDGDDTPDPPNVDIFDTIRELRNRLRDPSANGPPAGVLDDLDAALDQVLRARGTVGATLNRLDMTQDQLRSLEVTLEAQRSSLEDLDIVAAISELQSRENAFQASLAVTARVIQPSLLNFLR